MCWLQAYDVGDKLRRQRQELDIGCPRSGRRKRI